MSDVRPGPRGAFGPVAIRAPFPQAGQRTTRRGVGKHPAPSGALRHYRSELSFLDSCRREAPSTIRCIETSSNSLSARRLFRREAPSTIRCIETVVAPLLAVICLRVGKHPAPPGALRLPVLLANVDGRWGREAPSTIRCIETLASPRVVSFRSMDLAHNEAIGHHTPLHRPTSSNATAAPSTSALPAHDAHTG